MAAVEALCVSAWTAFVIGNVQLAKGRAVGEDAVSRLAGQVGWIADQDDAWGDQAKRGEFLGEAGSACAPLPARQASE